jgi:predicted esterase|eukprot:m.261371 g.261371  ORF g.261371 m.261371 type:complete len:265 (+) comp26668_c1_seq2:169-963(+)
MAAGAVTAQRRQLRVLCLHGHGQTPLSFREKTGGFRKGVKKLVDWTFLAAPHAAPPRVVHPAEVSDAAEGSDAYGAHGLSWYDFTALISGRPEGARTFLQSVQQSLDVIDAACEIDGPFDGVFAFSQGASLAALIMALSETRSNGVDVPGIGLVLGPHTSFGFAALAAGFLPGDGRISADTPHLEHTALLQPAFVAAVPIQAAAFVLYGTGDRIIPAERSQKLAALFVAPAMVEHEGGHHVPSSAVVRKAFQAFVQNEHTLRAV